MAVTQEKNLRTPAPYWSDDYASKKTQDCIQHTSKSFNLFLDALFGNVLPVFADNYSWYYMSIRCFGTVLTTKFTIV